MLKLRAAAYEDGYAIYTEGDRMFMLRPPYSKKEKVEVSEEALGRAVALHGFLLVEAEFETLPDLIARLKAQWREANPPRSQEEMEAGAKAALLQASTRSVARFLKDTEREMRCEKQWEESQRVLLLLLKNKNLQQDTGLWDKCIDLLTECDEALIAKLQRREESITDIQRHSQARSVLQKVNIRANSLSARRPYLPMWDAA